LTQDPLDNLPRLTQNSGVGEEKANVAATLIPSTRVANFRRQGAGTMNAAALRAHLESKLGGRVPSPFTYHAQVPVATVPSGIPEVDTLTPFHGLPRGALTEIFGPDSSGRTSFLLQLLATMTSSEEVGALVDATDAFDPHSARAAGVELDRLLWARCNKLEKALRTTELLLAGGGFGLVAVDLGDVPPREARRVPLAYWFRLRRFVERTPTVLVVLEQMPYAKTCASLVLRLEPHTACWSTTAEAATIFRREAPSHTCLLRGARSSIQVVRSRLPGEVAGSARGVLETGATFAMANKVSGSVALLCGKASPSRTTDKRKSRL
jgi:recombination protein RecA